MADRGTEEEEEDHHGGDFRVYMRHKRRKLDEQFTSRVAEKKNEFLSLFTGIRVWVDGLLPIPTEQLRDIVHSHGGTMALNMESSVTHILVDTKRFPLNRIGKHSVQTPILSYLWILDSVEKISLLSIHKYKVGQKAENAFAATNTLAKDSSHPQFLQDFMKSSRLHFIGSFKLHFEGRIGSLRCNHKPKYGPDLSLQSMRTLTPIDPANRLVVHIDMDCFFASVATRNDPSLQAKPVAISHCTNPGFGEVSTANYVARKYGVYSGMFLKEALEKCPDLIILPYQFDQYQEVSDIIYDTFFRYTHRVEAVSCDEVYLEFDRSDFNSPGDSEDSILKIVNDMRSEIFQATHCSASAGISHNMLLARMATKKAKPNGAFYLKRENVMSELSSFSIHDIPGVGYSLSKTLSALEIISCKDLLPYSSHKLEEIAGSKTGKMLWEFCRGIDKRSLQIQPDRKTIGIDVGWGVRFSFQSQVDAFLHDLCSELASRLQKVEKNTCMVTVKVRKRSAGAPEPKKHLGHGICDNISRSSRMFHPTDLALDIYKYASQLLQELKIAPEDVRGLGVTATKLHDKAQCRITGLGFARIEKSPITPHDQESKLQQNCSTSSKEELWNETVANKGGIHSETSSSGTILQFFSAKKKANRLKPKPVPRSSNRKTGFSSSHIRNISKFTRDYLTSIDWEIFEQLPVHLRQEIRADLEALKRRDSLFHRRVSFPSDAQISRTKEVMGHTMQKTEGILQPLSFKLSELLSLLQSGLSFGDLTLLMLMQIETSNLEVIPPMIRYLRRISNDEEVSFLTNKLERVIQALYESNLKI